MLTIIPKPCASRNYRVGRGANKPEGIVIHITDGSNEKGGVDAWFANPAAQVSAHYLVCKDGTIHLYVEEVSTAFHAGKVDRPTWTLAIQHPEAVNSRTIGIEHEGVAFEDITEAQYVASAELIAEIAARWSIQIDAENIVGHHAIRKSKPCPGKIDVARLIGMAKGYVQTQSPVLRPLS